MSSQTLVYWIQTSDTVSFHRDFHLIDVQLPAAYPVNKSFNLILETVQTHATHPWPETAGQNEEQALKYSADLFVISPYATSIQRTKIK